MTQKHGREFEHTLVNGVDEITPDEIWVTTAGFSGSANADACDLVIAVDPKLTVRGGSTLFTIEAKKRQGEGGKRVSNVFTGSSDDETGVEEVQRFIVNTPPWADSIIALKFDRRELVVLDATWLLSALDVDDSHSESSGQPLSDESGEVDESHVPDAVHRGVLDVLEPRVTPSGNVSCIKPSLDEWESATAASDDEEVLVDKLGLPHNDE